MRITPSKAIQRLTAFRVPSAKGMGTEAKNKGNLYLCFT